MATTGTTTSTPDTTSTAQTQATSGELFFQLAKTAIPALGSMGLKGMRLLVVAVVAFLAYLGATGQPLSEFIGSYSDYLNETLGALFAIVVADKDSGVRSNTASLLTTVANVIRPAETSEEQTPVASDTESTAVEAPEASEDITGPQTTSVTSAA